MGAVENKLQNMEVDMTKYKEKSFYQEFKPEIIVSLCLLVFLVLGLISEVAKAETYDRCIVESGQMYCVKLGSAKK